MFKVLSLIHIFSFHNLLVKWPKSCKYQFLGDEGEVKIKCLKRTAESQYRVLCMCHSDTEKTHCF